MKASPKSIRLPKTLKPDHHHKCAQCGTVWTCRDYTLEECIKKGVFKAVKVNGQGPYCFVCQEFIMTKRGYTRIPD